MNTTAYVILGLVIVLIILLLVIYNDLIKKRNKVHEAFSTMDVYLKKRWDLIPNLVETVKGYTKHEEETLKNIVTLRTSSYDKMKDNDKVLLNEKMEREMSKLFLLVENYPNLKASDVYIKLMKELVSVEEDIENSRKYYNACVRILNDKVEMFPSNMIASIFGFKKAEMFIISDKEKSVTKVEL